MEKLRFRTEYLYKPVRTRQGVGVIVGQTAGRLIVDMRSVEEKQSGVVSLFLVDPRDMELIEGGGSGSELLAVV